MPTDTDMIAEAEAAYLADRKRMRASAEKLAASTDLPPDWAQTFLDKTAITDHQQKVYQYSVGVALEQEAEAAPPPEPYTTADAEEAYRQMIAAMRNAHRIAYHLWKAGDRSVLHPDNQTETDVGSIMEIVSHAMTEGYWRWEELSPSFAAGGSQWEGKRDGQA
jgi:hypothetical protein